jgi:hypothetical protein
VSKYSDLVIHVVGAHIFLGVQVFVKWTLNILARLQEELHDALMAVARLECHEDWRVYHPRMSVISVLDMLRALVLDVKCDEFWLWGVLPRLALVRLA